MRRLFGLAVAAACFAGLLYHRLRKVPLHSGFRCETCGRAFSDLDDAGEEGAGYVSPLRKTFDRDGGGGRGEVTRSEWGPN